MSEPGATRNDRLANVLAAACLAIPAIALSTGFAESFRYPKLWAGEGLSLGSLLVLAVVRPRFVPSRAFVWFLPMFAAGLSLAAAGVTYTGTADLCRLLALAAVPVVVLAGRRPWRLRWVILGAAGVNALLAIAQAGGWRAPWAGTFTDRLAVYGTFGNPNYLAEYLAPACVIALGSWLAASGPAWIALTAFPFLMGALCLTVSRAGLLGFVVGFLLLLRHALKALGIRAVGRRLAWPAIPAAVIGVVLAGPLLLRLTSSFGADPGRSTRLFMWTAARNIWMSHPILGAGPGGFGLHYLDEAAKLQAAGARPDFPGITSDAHNDALQSLADRGLLGAVAWLAAFVLAILPAWRRRPVLTDPELIRAGTCLGAAAAVLVESLFGFPFRIFPTAAVFLWALASLPIPDLGDDRPARPNARWALIGFALAGLWLAGRSMVADAALAAGRGPAGEAALREGLLIAPRHGELHFRLGLKLRDAGRSDEAVSEFEAALAEFRDPDVDFNLGLINLSQKKYDEAATWFTAGLQRYPFYSARPWVDLATALVGAHRLPEARAAADRALAIDPGNRAAQALLSRIGKP